MTAKKLAAKRAELRAKGICLKSLCTENNVSYQAARDLLRGQLKGHRGEAHRAAVLLGLKPAPDSIKLAA
ncbi:MAG: DNA-binding protein [Hydrogenophilales bacterium]|jgi:gp16 family phage-associated protein|nr:DNA-binding protein [Hydrogenophilales bacterium]